MLWLVRIRIRRSGDRSLDDPLAGGKSALPASSVVAIDRILHGCSNASTVGDLIAIVRNTENVDYLVTACRSFPPLLAALAAEQGYRPELSRILQSSCDVSLAKTVGLELPAHRSPRASKLTVREREVLELIGSGLTNREIAKALLISEATAKAHSRRLYEKLSVRSRTEAALFAIRHGLDK